MGGRQFPKVNKRKEKSHSPTIAPVAPSPKPSHWGRVVSVLTIAVSLGAEYASLKYGMDVLAYVAAVFLWLGGLFLILDVFPTAKRWATLIFLTCLALGILHAGRYIVRLPGPQKAVTAFPTASQIGEELQKRFDGNRTNDRPLPAPVPVQPPLPHPEALKVEIENATLMSDQRDWPSAFWLRCNGANGEFIVPSNLAMFISVANVSSKPEHVKKLSVEMFVNDGWKELTRLPSEEANAIYSAYPTPEHPSLIDALKVAVKIDISQWDLGKQFADSAGRIPGNEVLRGWMLFEYPAGMPRLYSDITFRVTVSDILGRTSTLIRNRDAIKANSILKQYIKIPKGHPEDISALRKSHWQEQPILRFN